MSGYFQLIEGDDGAFMFSLRAGNHETVLTSRVFWSRQAALDGVATLRRQAQLPAAFLRHTHPDGRQWFDVVDDAGQPLGHSQRYASRSGIAAGMASVKRNSAATVFRGLVRCASVHQLAAAWGSSQQAMPAPPTPKAPPER